jgi:ethanolamine utilization protein EutN
VYKGMEGVPLLLVQPLDKTLKPKGRSIVACDATRMAGPGELVYYEGGREAAMALDPWFVPVDHSIIGIVDSATLRPDG